MKKAFLPDCILRLENAGLELTALLVGLALKREPLLAQRLRASFESVLRQHALLAGELLFGRSQLVGLLSQVVFDAFAHILDLTIDVLSCQGLDEKGVPVDQDDAHASGRRRLRRLGKGRGASGDGETHQSRDSPTADRCDVKLFHRFRTWFLR